MTHSWTGALPRNALPDAIRRRGFAVPVLAAALLASGVARALPPDPSSEPESTTYEYSPYEQEAIDLTLESLGTEIEPNPEGKTVERIEIVVLDVIEKRDPVPRFLNIFHAKSRRYTIERHVLLEQGQPYRTVLADETARSLRSLLQLSVVICVPIKGSTPDKVGLLVIAKDVWSMRLNWDVKYSNGGLEELMLQPCEANLLGTHHTISLTFELDPAAWALGTQYTIPRVTDYQLQAVADANMIVNRHSGESEGSYGSFSLGRELLSSTTPWSWLTSTAWLHRTTRRFVNAELATYDAEITPQDDRIPFSYKTRNLLHRTALTRSYGWAVKNDVSVGAEYDRREYEVPAVEGVEPTALDAFREDRVPVSTTRLSPYVQYIGYTTDFVRVLDFETLGLQEDYSLGHRVILKVYPASSELGSTRSLFGVFAAAQYTIPFIDGLVRVGVESETEAEKERLADGSIQGNWRVITPRLGFGRLLVDALVLHRYRNFQNRFSMLGGDNRLRGYPTNYFVGESVVANNLEFRTRPVEWHKIQLGAAAFYDVGGTFDESEALDLSQSGGFGLRTVFPQLERVVFRLDVGFPIERSGLPPGVAPVSFFASFHQPFGMPNVKPPDGPDIPSRINGGHAQD